ncbi:MAG: PTS sugar transporter subunit IIA [Mariniblastus sp.]|nr:PTS sugar transporter subunit IIA [Mariniblastus sp.]
MAIDDFDIDSLASYLHLTPEQVRKMAERSRLPGRRVGGQWKFSPAEIHHWFEDRIGVSDEPELVRVEKVLGTHREGGLDGFPIASLLNPERVAVPLVARTRNSVVEEMCELAARSGALWMPREMAAAIRNREALHPTALGNGVALLHPRRPQPTFFQDSFLAMGITGSGIPFGGPRGVMSDIFFLIASSDDSIHLRLLARMSRWLQQPELLDGLREATTPTQAWQQIVDVDRELDGAKGD